MFSEVLSLPVVTPSYMMGKLYESGTVVLQYSYQLRISVC